MYPQGLLASKATTLASEPACSRLSVSFILKSFSVQNVKILKNRLILLIEPGYYKENDFGIRIEDVAVVVPVQTKVKIKWRFIDNFFNVT